MNDSPQKRQGKIYTNMSCEAIRGLIKKRRNEKLNPKERNAVIDHCYDCRECLELNCKALDELIERLPKKEE